MAELERRHGSRSALWVYRNAEGVPVGAVVRWDREASKKILPVARTDRGWVIAGMPAPRPLYRLPDLPSTGRIYVTEGEKAADAAWSIGLAATTSAHGSKSAARTDWTPLAGRECVLLPDNDGAGRCYVEEVAAILTTLKPAGLVRTVTLPGLPPGGDMADFVAIREAKP